MFGFKTIIFVLVLMSVSFSKGRDYNTTIVCTNSFDTKSPATNEIKFVIKRNRITAYINNEIIEFKISNYKKNGSESILELNDKYDNYLRYIIDYKNKTLSIAIKSDSDVKTIFVHSIKSIIKSNMII